MRRDGALKSRDIHVYRSCGCSFPTCIVLFASRSGERRLTYLALSAPFLLAALVLNDSAHTHSSCAARLRRGMMSALEYARTDSYP